MDGRNQLCGNSVVLGAWQLSRSNDLTFCRGLWMVRGKKGKDAGEEMEDRGEECDHEFRE